MPSVAGTRKCRVQGCQRKPLFLAPGGDAGEATHCAAHRGGGFTLEEGFSLQDGFLLQHGQVVHNNYRGSSTYRNRTSTSTGNSNSNSNSNPGSSSGGGSGSGSGDHTQSMQFSGENQIAAAGGRGGGRGGKGRGGGRGRGRGRGRGDSGGRGRGDGNSNSTTGGTTTRGSAGQRLSPYTTCNFPGCPKTATYGSQKEATHCASHKHEDQIDHKHRLCESSNPKPCLKQPSFGWPKEAKKRFCRTHRKPGTVDLRNCEHEGCGTRASHGFGKGRARFCLAHSPPGTSIMANKPCEKVGCTVSPRFGVAGDRPRFCGTHKEQHMINLKDRRCEHHSCMTQPTFAFPGEKPRFCSKHKSEGQVNVRHKLCHHPQCKLVPTYGMMGTRVPVACLKHSDEEMVDLKRERVRLANAKRRAVPAAAGASSIYSGNGKASAGKAGTAGGSAEMLGRRTGPRATETMTTTTTTTTLRVLRAEKKRRRAKNQSLGGNPGIGRKIVDAIFASSQRVLEGEEAAATEESEWEEGSGGGQEDDEGGVNDDDEEEEDEEDEDEDEDEDTDTEKEGPMSGRRVYLPPSLLSAAMYPPPRLPIAIPPLLPPNDPPIANTGQPRRPFHESPLALLPGVVPRGGSAAHALEMVAAVAAAASVAKSPAAQGETNATTKGAVIERAGKRPRREELLKERPSISVNNPDAPREGAPRPGAGLGLEVARSGQQLEGQQQRNAGETEMHGNSGTSLTWICDQCGKPVPPDDRHVLVCCGYGVLHKACTAVFVQSACPCPKCFRLVSSSLQVFM